MPVFYTRQPLPFSSPNIMGNMFPIYMICLVESMISKYIQSAQHAPHISIGRAHGLGIQPEQPRGPEMVRPTSLCLNCQASGGISNRPNSSATHISSKIIKHLIILEPIWAQREKVKHPNPSDVDGHRICWKMQVSSEVAL